MIQNNNQETNDLSQNNLKSSDKTEKRHNTEIENDLGNTSFTPEEIEAANKTQPNVSLAKASATPSYGNDIRDTERVSARANEAADSTDTNTGGIIAGGAKGASQS